MDRFKKASLLPYLNPRQGFHLAIAGPPGFDSSETRFPFSIFNDVDPLTRTVHAAILTNTGSVVSRIMLACQRDQYQFTPDGLWPLNNSDIDACWQETLKSFERDLDVNGIIQLAGPIDSAQNGQPFHSLFYCHKQHHYFHPPCPTCGGDLILCRDDQRLIQSGLSPYTTSLKRYLHCPSCAVGGDASGFYKHTLEADDPHQLNDCQQLILKFGQTPENTAASNFPCPGCPDKGNCFGPEGLVLKHIVPFGFYPFYMQITTADKLAATDFIKLLSGATPDDLENGAVEGESRLNRQPISVLLPPNEGHDLYFFNNDRRFFLEVLYLKLVFLEDLSQQVLNNLNTFRPEFGLSMERIIVKPGGLNNLLPYWWNFKVSLLHMGGRTADISFLPNVPPAYGLHFLGIICFFVLLENRNQDRRMIYEAIETQFENIAASGDSREIPLNAVFEPQNVFYDPSGKTIEAEWTDYWQRATDLGWQLLKASLNMISDWSMTGFIEELRELRGALKKELLTAQASAATIDKPLSTTPDEPAAKLSIHEQQQIYTILQGIKGKWRSEIGEGQKRVAENPDSLAASDLRVASEAETNGQLGANVVLGEGGADAEYDDGDTVTVLHDPGAANRMHELTEEDPAERASLEENMINTSPDAYSTTNDDEADVLQETVVISTNKAAELMRKVPHDEVQASPPATSEIPEDTSHEWDQLNATLIVKSPKQEPSSAEEHEAGLNETVIVKNRKAPQTTSPVEETPSRSGMGQPVVENIPQEDQLDQTMIINPKKMAANMRKKMATRNNPPPRPPASQNESDKEPEDDLLAKTVIIRSKKNGPKGPQK